MLTNNFRQLISFYTSGTFKNVLGETVAKTAVLGGQGHNTTADSIGSGSTGTVNGHEHRASSLSYSYNSTSSTNSYTQEKTAYKWLNIVCGQGAGSVSTTNVNYTYNGFILFVGNGTTAPTANDYCLGNAVELSVVSAYCNTNSYNKTYVARTFENNTGSDVTINEVGCYLFKSVALAKDTATPSTVAIMVGRIVLPSPVTIAVGEQKTFTYCIDLSTISLGG